MGASLDGVAGGVTAVAARGGARAPAGRNDHGGVYITNGAQYNQIGVSGAGNVVAGNGGDGVKIDGSGVDYNTVRGNNIGLNFAQNAKRGNTSNGVTIAGGAKHNTVGGSGVGEGNVIAGNGVHGIGMYDANTNANHVYSNTIGTNHSSAVGSIRQG
jgi:hypothetical protein